MTALMRAAALEGPRRLSLVKVPAPAADPGDVVVRVRATGVCGTDYGIWSGERAVRYPRVLGHEAIGIVERVGEGVETLGPGARVAVEPNYSCGACALCREGNRNLCARRTAVGIDVDGAFAELVRVPARCCWPLPAELDDADALLAEPLAVVVRAAGRVAPRPGETAAVLGGGTLGLLALQVLRARGCRVLVVSRSRRRRGLAETLGAAGVHALADGPAEDAARAFSGREGVDLVVETAGTPEAIADALALVRPGGRVALTGLPHAPARVDFLSVVRREVTLTGSMIYRGEFPDAVALLAAGLVRGAPLVSHRFTLEAVADALPAHRDPAAIKVAVYPEEAP